MAASLPDDAIEEFVNFLEPVAEANLYPSLLPRTQMHTCTSVRASACCTNE